MTDPYPYELDAVFRGYFAPARHDRSSLAGYGRSNLFCLPAIKRQEPKHVK